MVLEEGSGRKLSRFTALVARPHPGHLNRRPWSARNVAPASGTQYRTPPKSDPPPPDDPAPPGNVANRRPRAQHDFRTAAADPQSFAYKPSHPTALARVRRCNPRPQQGETPRHHLPLRRRPSAPGPTPQPLLGRCPIQREAALAHTIAEPPSLRTQRGKARPPNRSGRAFYPAGGNQRTNYTAPGRRHSPSEDPAESPQQ